MSKAINESRVMGFVLSMALLIFTPVFTQKLPRLSPRASVYQQVGLTDITITYSSPGVKGRVIWGGLVPYHKIWRTGANEATNISFSDDVKVNGNPLPAGKYALFTIPTPSEWTIIFNREPDQWGAFNYDSQKDVLRIQVKPQPAEHRERMMFYFDNLTKNSVDVVLRWEKLRVPFTVEVEVIQKALANARKTMANLKPDDWQTAFRCAGFCLNADTNLKEGLSWANRSISIKETYWNVSLKAKFLARMGKKKEAVDVGEKAIRLSDEMDNPPGDVVKFKKLLAEWKSGI